MSNEVVLVEPPITRPTVGKRKGSDVLHEEIGEAAPAKKRPKKSGNSKAKAEPDAHWPEYFQNVNIIVIWLLLRHLMRLYAALHGNELVIVLKNPDCETAPPDIQESQHRDSFLLF
jgi:hypothetical protein